MVLASPHPQIAPSGVLYYLYYHRDTSILIFHFPVHFYAFRNGRELIHFATLFRLHRIPYSFAGGLYLRRKACLLLDTLQIVSTINSTVTDPSSIRVDSIADTPIM